MTGVVVHVERRVLAHVYDYIVLTEPNLTPTRVTLLDRQARMFNGELLRRSVPIWAMRYRFTGDGPVFLGWVGLVTYKLAEKFWEGLPEDVVTVEEQYGDVLRGTAASWV
jgi:hypothetical protein